MHWIIVDLRDAEPAEFTDADTWLTDAHNNLVIELPYEQVVFAAGHWLGVRSERLTT